MLGVPRCSGYWVPCYRDAQGYRDAHGYRLLGYRDAPSTSYPGVGMLRYRRAQGTGCPVIGTLGVSGCSRYRVPGYRDAQGYRVPECRGAPGTGCLGTGISGYRVPCYRDAPGSVSSFLKNMNLSSGFLVPGVGGYCVSDLKLAAAQGSTTRDAWCCIRLAQIMLIALVKNTSKSDVTTAKTWSYCKKYNEIKLSSIGLSPFWPIFVCPVAFSLTTAYGEQLLVELSWSCGVSDKFGSSDETALH
ncbi:hypothetical protein WISP_58103 [Willisornis vidua]|uniref:Uncharacterized protein n=1 Tax=Willisornis vidua TaxID=1566151 RepID=A0ABQ9DBX8_9PASS|nr:hypothetical protein WISP_58103 [Willisornis vidua]